MKASLIDRSNYYKGLLVLIGRDRIIDRSEQTLMLQIGKMLDFDKLFCEAAIENLLENKHITDEPVLFDEPLMAQCFLRDALQLARTDKEIHSQELSWLKTVARANKLTDAWLDKEIQRLYNTSSAGAQPDSFEIRLYI